MRRLWILAAVMSLSMAAKANHEKASIVIRSDRGIPLIVQLDGQRPQQAGPVVHFNNIRPGRHYVKIFRKHNRQHQYGHHGHGQRELIYSGQIRVRPGFKSVFKLHHGYLELVSQRPMNGYGSNPGYGPGPGYGNGPACGNDGGYGPGYGGSGPGYGSGNGHNGNNGNPGWNGGHQGYRQAASDRFFQAMISRSKTQFMDAQKVRFFQRETSGKYVSISQLKKMSRELTFEQEKFKLLTSMYDRAVRPDRYHELKSVFTFNNTKREFEDFIRSYSSIKQK